MFEWAIWDELSLRQLPKTLNQFFYLSSAKEKSETCIQV